MDHASSPNRPRRQIGIGGALAGMVITFLLGVYVGVHPAWLPIKTTSVEDFSRPLKPSTTDAGSTDRHPTTTPQTRPG
jgi:cell division protein FtsN